MLNPRKGDMYKFVNYTWNPIKGKCLHDCSYCYMKQINPNFNPPRLAEYELNTDLGCGRSIFIGSSTDMFAKDIPSKWIDRVLDYCHRTATCYCPMLTCYSPRTPRGFWSSSTIRLWNVWYSVQPLRPTVSTRR